MDGFNNNFGNLSLGAAEWQPPSHSQAQKNMQQQQLSNLRYNDNHNRNNNKHATNSDFVNPNQVKEFIPGQGWSVSSASAPSTKTSRNDDVSRDTNGMLLVM